MCNVCFVAILVNTTQATTTKACDCSTLVPLGVSDKRVPDKDMRSNFIRVNAPGTSKHTGPEQARLNNEPSSTGAGAWEPNDPEGYIDIYFDKIESLKRDTDSRISSGR